MTTPHETAGARWLTTLSFLPDDLAIPAGPTVVAASHVPNVSDRLPGG